MIAIRHYDHPDDAEDEDREDEGSMLVLTAENPPGFREPTWKRTIVYDPAGDRILAPASMLGDDEEAISTAAMWDEVAMVLFLGHLFLPIDWMEAQEPDLAEVFRRVEAVVRQAREEGR